MNNKRTFLVGFAWGSVIFGANALKAETPNPLAGSDRLFQAEVKQQQVRTDMQKVSEQLAALINEFERNGLGGDDVDTLKAMETVLGKLSEKELKQVIESLQQARSTKDGNTSRQQVTSAYTTQKNIVLALRQVLLENQRRQALYEISIRLEQLANRQGENLRQAIQLAKWANGKATSAYDETQKSALQVQQVEQDSLLSEVQPILTKLQSLAKESTTDPRPLAALKQASDGQLVVSLTASIEALKSSQVYNAAGTEKTARDQLREMARLLNPPKDEAAAIREEKANLEKIIAQEKSILENTIGQKQAETAELEARQATNADATDVLRKDMEKNAAASPALLLAEATDKMQEARAALSERNRDVASKREKEALARLEQARELLAEELAKAEPMTPEEKLEKLEELQKEIHELAQQEQTAKDETVAAEKNPQALKAEAPKLDALEKKAKELQKEANVLAPEVAPALAEAAKQDDNAEKAADQQNAPKAEKAEDAAIAALKQAEQQIAQAVAQQEKAEQAAADAAKTIDQAQQEIAQAVQELEAKTQLQALAQQEKQIAKDLAANAQQQPSKPVAQAQQAAQAAAQDIAKNDLADAIKEAKQVDAALQQALQDQQGKPDQQGKQDQPSLQQLADQQAQVEQKLEQALAAQQASPAAADAQQAAKQDLQKAADQLAPLAADAQNAIPAAAQAAIQQAEKELAEAIKEAATDPAQATADAQEAQQALAKAEAALNQGPPGAPKPQQAKNSPPQPGKPEPGEPKTQTPPGGVAQKPPQQPSPTPPANPNQNAKNESSQTSLFLGLPARDRQAIKQSAAEKYPQEYGPLVEQYLKNLSEQSEAK